MREGTNPDELLVDEGFNAILVGIIQKKFGLVVGHALAAVAPIHSVHTFDDPSMSAWCTRAC